MNNNIDKDKIKVKINVDNYEDYLKKNESQINKLFEITLNNNKNATSEEARKKLSDSLKKVNNIFSEMEEKNRPIKSYENIANKIITEISDCLNFCDTVFSENDASEEVQKLYNQVLNKYRRLEFLLFNYKIKSLKSYYDTLQNDIKEIEKLKDKQEKLSEEVFEKIEGIGSTTLNMILTISIVTAAIAIVVEIKDTKYIPMFILSVVWILFTSIIFNASMFKSRNIQMQKLDYNEILCIITYSLLSLGTLACILVTCLK